MCTGSPGLGVLRRLRPARPVQRSARLSRRRAGCPPPGTRPGGSRVHHHSLGGGGARLYPGGLATGYAADLPRGLPGLQQTPARKFPPQQQTAGRAAPGPYPPGSSRCHSQGRKTPVPRVLLSATLAGPAPSGSTRTSRLCQGCSRPPRHHPDQAALSYTTLLRQDGGEGLSPPLESTAPHGARMILDTP